jgi:hypothetical protein
LPLAKVRAFIEFVEKSVHKLLLRAIDALQRVMLARAQQDHARSARGSQKHHALESPRFFEWPRLHFEAPSPPILAAELKGDFSDARRIDKAVRRPVWHCCAGSGQLHHAIDDDQRNVDAGGPELAGHGFCKTALCRFGRGKRRRLYIAAAGRCGPNEDDGAGPLPLHIGNHFLGTQQSAIGVDAPGLLELLGRD